MEETDVCILGAGPAGATAALFLAQEGVECVLVDKAKFPREKVCGDALSGKVVDILQRLNPNLVLDLAQEGNALGSWGITLVAPNGHALKLPFPDSQGHPPGFTCPRSTFDNLLVEEVRKHRSIRFVEGVELDPVESDESGIVIASGNSDLTLRARLIIAANGAYSSFARHWARLPREFQHYGAGVTAYFENVEGFDPRGYVELHFLKDFLPGYFWVFPLQDGKANAGVYVRSDVVIKRKINLKKCLLGCIETHPSLKPRFAKAQRLGQVRGYGLPLGSRVRTLSGDHYLLAGDAGHLIDPFTGEGIGNAMLSGMLAARQAIRCRETNDYSASALASYDAEIAKHLAQEFKISHWVQRLSTSPYLWNLLVRIANSDPKISGILSRMLGDGALREKLVDPMAYVRLMVRKWKYLFTT